MKNRVTVLSVITFFLLLVGSASTMAEEDESTANDPQYEQSSSDKSLSDQGEEIGAAFGDPEKGRAVGEALQESESFEEAGERIGELFNNPELGRRLGKALDEGSTDEE